jgi:hypothetical protein
VRPSDLFLDSIFSKDMSKVTQNLILLYDSCQELIFFYLPPNKANLYESVFFCFKTISSLEYPKFNTKSKAY